jgi:hypothetical protein
MALSMQTDSSAKGSRWPTIPGQEDRKTCLITSAMIRGASVVLLLATAALLLLAGCATQSPSGHAEILPAKVFRLKGTARWKTGADQPWQEVKKGMKIPVAAIIQTASKSYVSICFGNSPKPIKVAIYEHPSGRILRHELSYDYMVRLLESSRVRFDRIASARPEGEGRVPNDVRLELSAGHIIGLVPKLPEGSRYEVKFPGGEARVACGIYDVCAEGVIKVLEGSAWVTYEGADKPQLVMSNQMLDVRIGVVHAIIPAEDCL